MNLLSLFNGGSGLHYAFDCAKIKVDKCYYSEIDKWANLSTETHYPNDIPLGDVLNWREWDIDWSSIDFVTAGFPCQSWSVAGLQKGDKDPRGQLFWVTLDIIQNVLEHNPNAKFLMENVKMCSEFEQYISYHTEEALGDVFKILIDAGLVSAQSRERYYWTNFEIEQPADRGLYLLDILEDIKGDRPCVVRWNRGNGHFAETLDIKGMDCIKRIYHPNQKAPTLTTMGGGHREPKVYCANGLYRKLTISEMLRLQGLPDYWYSMLSDTQAKKCIGNGWQNDVIVHILHYLKKALYFSK